MAKRPRLEDMQPQARNDAYTVMLTISLVAMIGACMLLYNDLKKYQTLTPTAKNLEVSRIKVDAGGGAGGGGAGGDAAGGGGAAAATAPDESKKEEDDKPKGSAPAGSAPAGTAPAGSAPAGM